MEQGLRRIFKVLGKAGAHAALAASIFHYQETSIKEIKSYLKEQGTGKMAGIKVNEIKWGKDNLVPAIVQDYLSGKVLMVGYMNKIPSKDLRDWETWFWSRSRGIMAQRGHFRKYSKASKY